MPPAIALQTPPLTFRAIDEDSTRAAVECLMHGEIVGAAIIGEFFLVEFKAKVPLIQAGTSLRCSKICTLCGVTVYVDVPINN